MWRLLREYSLVFLEKVVPHPTPLGILLLVLSWAAFITAIALVARVRYYNLKSARLALDDQFSAATKIDNHTDVLSKWSQIALITGMSCLFLMGLLNINRYGASDTDMQKFQKGSGNRTSANDSIPYGSLDPGNGASGQKQQGQESAQQQPHQPPTSPNTNDKK